MDKEKIVTWVVGAIIVAIVAVNIMNFLRPHGSRALVGDEAPNFTLPLLNEESALTLSETRGKVVVLDFWATWCPPCRKQMPALQELADDPEFAETLQVISVNTDDADDDRDELVGGFMRRSGLTMTTVMDNGSVRRLYRVRAIPTLIVIDANGKVRHTSEGAHSVNQLRDLVRMAH